MLRIGITTPATETSFPWVRTMKTTSSQPHFLTFCPNRKWAILLNLFLIMSILSWLHILSSWSITFWVCRPCFMEQPLRGSLFLSCAWPGLVQQMQISWRIGSNIIAYLGSRRSGCTPGGQVAVLTPLFPGLWPLGLRPFTLMVFSCSWEIEGY